MTNDLYNTLPINRLLPNLVSKHVIDFTDYEEICVETTERRRVLYFLENCLVKGLDCSEVWDTNRFYRFLTVLKECPQCDELVTRIYYWMEQYKEYSATPDKKDQLLLEGYYFNIYKN